jgi:hypothetical protein
LKGFLHSAEQQRQQQQVSGLQVSEKSLSNSGARPTMGLTSSRDAPQGTDQPQGELLQHA